MASWAVPSKAARQGLWNGSSVAARIDGREKGPRCLPTVVEIVQATGGVC